MDTILKKATIFLLLTALLFGCKDQGPQLPDPDTLFPTPEPGPAYVVIDGDTIPIGYSKTIDDLTRMLSIDDDVDLLTIHGTSGAKVWKKFYASVLKSYVMDSLSTLGDVTITNISNGQGITWNGSAWVNTTLAGAGDVTTAQLADSTAAVRADFPTDTDTQLSEEQVEDFVGGMVGGTQTLITVTYNDGGGVLNFVVDNDLSNYDNSTSAFLTTENDGSPTNELITGSGTSAATITITDAGGTQTIQNLALATIIQVAPSGATQAIDWGGRASGLVQIDVTSASSPLTLTVSNPNSSVVSYFTFHFLNTPIDVVFPAAFLNADGTSLGTVSYSSDDFVTCYFDGTNYYCK